MIEVTCDYCGADNTSLVFTTRDTNYHFAGVFNIVQCKQCGLTYLNPRPEQDTIALYYPDAEYACYTDVIETSAGLGPNSRFIRTASEMGIHGGSLCEVGCGVGNFLVAARQSGWTVTGIETNNHARRLCNERLGEEVVFPSLEGRFQPESFDAVVLWHVLEHLPSPRRTLEEIHRVLRPRGLLGLAVPNFSSLERRIWGSNWIAVMAPTHFYHFSEFTLVRHLEATGFVVMAVHQGSAANSLGSNVLRTLRRWLLDPFARKAEKSEGTDYVQPNASNATGLARSSESHYRLDGQTKKRALQITTKVVYPLAWIASRLGLGPELLVYARRSQRQVESLRRPATRCR